MEKVTLFSLNEDHIKISMELYFNERNELFFDGYDIGKRVEDIWGDSDYEYCYTINPSEVKKLYKFYKINEGERSALLNTLKEHFSGNQAYSKFGAFMKKNGIEYSASS